MERMNKTPDIEGDTDQWEWVPAERHTTNARAFGATALAAGCLMMGVFFGILGGSAFQRPSATVVSPEIPKISQSSSTPSSEPTLALGSGSEMPVKPLDPAPQTPFVINEGSAKAQPPRRPELGNPGAKAKAAEAELPKARETELPDVSLETKAASMPERERLVGKQKTPQSRPARPLSSEGSFKDYRALRNHVLGK
jgi:hypothetical protein